MAFYRLQYHSLRNGGYRGMVPLDAPDDFEAIRRAARRTGRRPAQLWCEGRLVHSFEGRRIGRGT